MVKTTEEIEKAAAKAYGKAMHYCLSGGELFKFAFAEGMRFERTGECPKSYIEEVFGISED